MKKLEKEMTWRLGGLEKFQKILTASLKCDKIIKILDWPLLEVPLIQTGFIREILESKIINSQSKLKGDRKEYRNLREGLKNALAQIDVDMTQAMDAIEVTKWHKGDSEMSGKLKSPGSRMSWW